MKILIVGGGPSGLYLGLLVRRQRPDIEVTVYEQNCAEDTFGFGVVLADAGLSNLEKADYASFAALRQAMSFSHRQTICLNNQAITIKHPGAHSGAISRVVLLRILQDHCRQAGVELRFSTRLDSQQGDFANALESADLVVGADGVNSIIRSCAKEQFGTTYRLLTNRFCWYGTQKVFDNPALVFRQYQGGHFIAHYYPYGDSMSTFVAECDQETWINCGLEHMSDGKRQTLFEQVFASELEGASLMANNSIWRQFPVIRNRYWSVGKQVLMGDALASAHFSIGSGTRIAMEDSIALANAIAGSKDNVSAIVGIYESNRRPGKTRLIEASERSFMWFEDIVAHMACASVHEFVYGFMTRTGRIDANRLKAQYPELIAAIETARVKAAA